MKTSVNHTKSASYNKSRVMKLAWFYYRKDEKLSWSGALTMAWNTEKTVLVNFTFESVYKTHYKNMLNLANKSLFYKNIEQAEEITQDVFVKFNERYILNFNPEMGNVKNLLFTMVKNKVTDYLRKYNDANKVANIENFVDSEGKETFTIESNYNTNDIETEETNTVISDAMSCLNDKEQKIAMLFFIEQKQYTEICELLDLKMGTVKGSINRIRTKLQAKLNPYVQS